MNLTGAKECEHQKKECQMSKKNHNLYTCFKYKKLQVDERKRRMKRIYEGGFTE